nr:hypothetical protein [Deinococcus aetherius]
MLPDMRVRGRGTLLFTTGAATVLSVPAISSVAVPLAALRKYALDLNAELADQGIYAAHVCIGRVIEPGTEGDPDRLAEACFELYQQRDRAERLLAFPER